MNKTVSGRLQGLKNKVQLWVIPKVVAVRLREFFFSKFKSAHFRTGLHRDRGGHNQSWSLTWPWVVARRSFRCFWNSVSVSLEAGKVKVKDTMDGFFGALVSMTSPSWIQLFICLDVPLLCVFLILFHIFLLMPRVKINFIICAWSWVIDKLWIKCERLVSLH